MTIAAGTAIAIGHSAFANRPTPIQMSSQARYIGFRVNRNGPFVTMTVEGRVGFGVVPAPIITLAAEAMSAPAIANRMQPVMRTIPKPLPPTCTGTAHSTRNPIAIAAT